MARKREFVVNSREELDKAVERYKYYLMRANENMQKAGQYQMRLASGQGTKQDMDMCKKCTNASQRYTKQAEEVLMACHKYMTLERMGYDFSKAPVQKEKKAKAKAKSKSRVKKKANETIAK